jgi:hypothetical protein
LGQAPFRWLDRAARAKGEVWNGFFGDDGIPTDRCRAVACCFRLKNFSTGSGQLAVNGIRSRQLLDNRLDGSLFRTGCDPDHFAAKALKTEDSRKEQEGADSKKP